MLLGLELSSEQNIMQSDEPKRKGNKVEDISAKLEGYVKSIAKQEGYITYDVEKKDLSSKGGSYMGTLFEINVKGKTENGNKETNVFVKHIVFSQHPLTFDVAKVYKREKFVYTDLRKVMYDLQEKENVPVEERFKIAKAFKECTDQTIILENLAARGFKTYYRMDVINLEYAELAVKDLARLHGLSFAMELKNPDYFEKKIKNLDCLYIFDQNWHGFKNNMLLFSLQYLTDDVRNKVATRLTDIVYKYPGYMTDTSCIKTICHGDFRHNNIMVKEINGKPTEVMVVDFQITHLGNPVLDFIYFIFWGTDQEFRRQHLDHLKHLYHQYLRTFLKYFNIDVEDVFPKKEFERQYKEKLDFGLEIAALYLPFLFPPEDAVTDVANTNEPLSRISIKVDEKFRERFRGIVEDFIRWGYL